MGTVHGERDAHGRGRRVEAMTDARRTAEDRLREAITDAIETRSACGFMWMRMAVASDIEDGTERGQCFR